MKAAQSNTAAGNWRLGLRRLVCVAAVGAVFLLSRDLASAQPAASANLEKVLAQMDEAAAKFHSAQAEFQWDQFERVVSSTDTQTGRIYFLGNGTSTEMAAEILTSDGQPSKKTIVFKDGVLKFYQPEINQLTIFHAGKKQDQYESFLTLGFGGSGSDLKKNWDIAYQGMETIDGVQTAKLDLVSKLASVRNNFTHVTIWVDPARAISLKQEMFEPSGDIRTDYFRNIEYNKKISASVFKIKTNSKTQTVEK